MHPGQAAGLRSAEVNAATGWRQIFAEQDASAGGRNRIRGHGVEANSQNRVVGPRLVEEMRLVGGSLNAIAGRGEDEIAAVYGTGRPRQSGRAQILILPKRRHCPSRASVKRLNVVGRQTDGIDSEIVNQTVQIRVAGELRASQPVLPGSFEL